MHKPYWFYEVDVNSNINEIAQLKIRIPATLRKQLQQESIAQQRSMNAQINFILKQFMQMKLIKMRLLLSQTISKMYILIYAILKL